MNTKLLIDENKNMSDNVFRIKRIKSFIYNHYISDKFYAKMNNISFKVIIRDNNKNYIATLFKLKDNITWVLVKDNYQICKFIYIKEKFNKCKSITIYIPSKNHFYKEYVFSNRKQNTISKRDYKNIFDNSFKSTKNLYIKYRGILVYKSKKYKKNNFEICFLNPFKEIIAFCYFLVSTT